jgi:hypothetical protein
MPSSRLCQMGEVGVVLRSTALRYRRRPSVCNKRCGKRFAPPYTESSTPRPWQTCLSANASFPRPRAITFRACAMVLTTQESSVRRVTEPSLGVSRLQCLFVTSYSSIRRRGQSLPLGAYLAHDASRASTKPLDNLRSPSASMALRLSLTSTARSRPTSRTLGGGHTPVQHHVTSAVPDMGARGCSP